MGEGPFATSSKYVGMFTYDADIPQAKDAIPLLMDHYKVSRDKICMKGTDPHSLLENDDSELFADFTNSKGVNRTHRAHYAIVSDPENKYGLSPSSYICGGYFRRQKETRQAPPIYIIFFSMQRTPKKLDRLVRNCFCFPPKKIRPCRRPPPPPFLSVLSRRCCRIKHDLQNAGSTKTFLHKSFS